MTFIGICLYLTNGSSEEIDPLSALEKDEKFLYITNHYDGCNYKHKFPLNKIAYIELYDSETNEVIGEKQQVKRNE